MRVRERCGCGSGVDVTGDDPGSTVRDWRDNHLCDRRPAVPARAGARRVDVVPAAAAMGVGFTSPARPGRSAGVT